MLVHSVFFTLRDDLEPPKRDVFVEGLRTLESIPGVRAIYIGPPAPTPARPVIRTDYDFGLTVVLDDVATHNAYQVHPVHKGFVQQFSSYWETVEIFDINSD